MKFVSQASQYIHPENLKRAIQKVHPGLVITEGTFSDRVPGTVRDIEWNHLDQAHRIYIHDAYHEALRMVTGKDFAHSVTRWKNLPIFIQVFDARIDRGLFYQTFNVFGLIFCHQVCRLTQVGEDVDISIHWYTASHWLFKFLHGFFNRSLLKLQTKQDREDYVIRKRRFDLRKRSLCFKTDEPDFLNANVLSDSVVFPSDCHGTILDISTYEAGVRHKILLGPAEFFILKTENSVSLWPALCPHEGAEMDESHFCGDQIVCPWHARKFRPFELSPTNARRLSMGNALISYDGQKLFLHLANDKFIAEEHLNA